MKKLLSVILSAAIIVSSFAIASAGTFTVQAADYATTLKNKGFPESYIKSLTELHNKYPNWIFEPLQTNLDFQTAVNGERKTHSNQLIQKTTSTNTSMYCNCSLCMKNGSYVIQEASNWVSASETAVKYYMDPRNFLTEQGIFQFESTAYDGTQTQEGVESILNGTWMYKSLITYKTATGATATYDNSTKYSDAIIKAANDSGMGAYYLASKIRQEVGGTTPTAGGASGTDKTYPGIYNYYNIGAYTGATDGLIWASKSSVAGYSTNCSCYVRKSPTTSSESLVLLKENTSVTVNSTTAKQPDGYKWYNVTVTYNNKKYTGYIRSDLVSYSSGDSYNRPWTNPYLSIYNGAKYISQNYKTQFTGYLQKFNVNPASDTLHTHEYMANVAAAYSESITTYNAYKNAGILSITKTFSIPVFKNMPDDTSTNTSSTPDIPSVTGLKAVSSDTKSISLTWDAIKNVTGYRIEIYKNGSYQYYGLTKTNSVTVSGLNACQAYKIRVRAYQTVNGVNYWGKLWVATTYGTRAHTVANFKGTGSSSSVNLSWTATPNATGYRVFKYNPSTKAYVLYKDITGTNSTSCTVTGLSSSTTYQFKIYAYLTYEGKTYNGFCGNAISVKTSASVPDIPSVTGLKAVSSDTKSISLTWDAIKDVTGYRVEIYKNGSYQYYGLTKTNKITVTGLNSCQAYKIRVRAYKTVNGKNYWGKLWVATTYATRASLVSNFRSTGSNNGAIYLSWTANSKATGYKVFIYDTAKKSYVLYKDVKGAKNNSLKVTNLKNNTKYQFKIYAYLTYDGKTYNGYCSNALSASTKYNMVTLNSAVSNSTKSITVKWNKALYSCTGYEVMWSTTSNFSSNFLSVYVKGQNATSTTLKTSQSGKYYYVRVRAYNESNGKKTYCSWSAVKKVKVK